MFVALVYCTYLSGYLSSHPSVENSGVCGTSVKSASISGVLLFLVGWLLLALRCLLAVLLVVLLGMCHKGRHYSRRLCL